MELYELFKKYPVICTDSRNCPKGSLFFALKGDNFNANAFAGAALSAGCAYAVVDDPEFAVDERYIVVENVLETLQALARYHRLQLGTTIVGITGTNGKTTTKELIAAVLSEKYNVLYTQGNLNNHIGVPLTLLKLTPGHEMAVIEMGANHPGEIKALVEIACPDYGIITNVGKAHLEGFGSFEGVKKTKAELYDYIYSQGKDIFLNRGNQHLVEMAKKSGFVAGERVHTYSVCPKDEPVYVTGEIVDCSPFLKLSCQEDEQFEVETKLIGTYNAENVLAAVTIGHFFGVNNKQIKEGLEKYTPQNNRSQLTVTDRNKLVVDAYNANPTSMAAAVKNFGQMQVDNKVLILGDMLELGEQSETEHQNIIRLLESFRFDKVMLVGKQFAATANSFTTYENVDELLSDTTVLESVTDSYVLIKGSRGIRLEKVIPRL
ncbi:MAG: UDP-N-acetylmuramoyl-tripeptide--D-alanyl-D-alanine ligase [Paludibacter sp.]|nr:UDP-N-acetylmuramoyl-tripeptide--D-alanyl-D-alanine ligase [Paludibacter sp.]